MMTPAERTPEQWAAEVARLERQMAELQQRVPWDEEPCRLAKHRQFGASQERSDTVPLHLFNEAETLTGSPVDASQETITYTRQKKTPGQRDAAFAHLPVERIPDDLPDADRVCDTCQGPLHAMSTEIRRELLVIPAQVPVIEHVQQVYACRPCERDALITPIKTAPMLSDLTLFVQSSLTIHVAGAWGPGRGAAPSGSKCGPFWDSPVYCSRTSERENGKDARLLP